MNPVAIRSASRNLILFCGAFFLLVAGVVFLAIRVKTHGHFVYTLDDPYIHLALAENLAHGHYGINPTEYSSPSSSVLWPFLLIPFAGTAFHAWMPLLWNLVFGTAAACLLGMIVAKWPPQREEQGGMQPWKQVTTAVLLIGISNLIGLTFTGMEHTLQVLLAICCATGAIYALAEGRVPGWCQAAAVVAPMVRYENLAVTLALCLALAGLRQWSRAAAIFGLSLVPLAAFSAFLHSRGLPMLPMSVLVKGNVYANANFAVKLFKLLRQSIYLDLISPDHYPVLILFLSFAGLAWKATGRVRRWVFGGAAVVGALQLTVGRFGWWGRYEIYALIFLTLLLLYVLSEQPAFFFGYFAAGLIFFAATYIRIDIFTPAAAQDVYRMEYQMRRFVGEYYPGDYAVNDLGLMSFQRRPGAYVLDVYGLASPEASRHPVKTAAWLDEITRRYGVHLAILFPEWFQIPSSWVPVAKLCEPTTPMVLAEQCMVFYSTSQAAVPEIREALQRFGPTLPSDVIFYFDPDPRWGGLAPAVPPKRISAQ